MPNYKKMYIKLFNEVTDTIDRLRQVQQEAEDMYISEETFGIYELEKPEE